MAITKVSHQAEPVGFVVNATSTDLSAIEELVAAGGTGTNIYVTSLMLSSGGAVNYTFGAGETASSPPTLTATLIGPIYMAANTQWEKVFRKPLKVTTNTALVVTSSGAASVGIVVEGYVK